MYHFYEFQRQFKRDNPSWEQDYALSRLLWYLNSGGRRSYVVIERPDQKERNQPRPDYVCQDKRKGHYITVEVTRINVPPRSLEMQAFEEKLGYEVAKRVAGQLRGTYQLFAEYPVNVRGRPISTVADQLAQEILESQDKLTLGGRIPLSFGLELYKFGNEGSELLLPQVIRIKNKPEIDFVSDADLFIAIREAVKEAALKLRSYSKGARLLLLCQDLALDHYDFVYSLNIPARLGKKRTKYIDRCYVLHEHLPGLLSYVFRLW